MMSPNTNTPPGGSGAISEQTLSELREALTRHSRRREDDTTDLRRLLFSFAREARAHNLGPEKLLVIFKNIWNGIPDVHSAGDRTEKGRMLERLVTICIEEYYREER
jgi:hypothetical protein